MHNASQAFVHSCVLLSCDLPRPLPPRILHAQHAWNWPVLPYKQLTLAPASCTKNAGHVWFLPLVYRQLGQSVAAVLGHAKPTWQACVLSVSWCVQSTAAAGKPGRQACKQKKAQWLLQLTSSRTCALEQQLLQ